MPRVTRQTAARLNAKGDSPSKRAKTEAVKLPLQKPKKKEVKQKTKKSKEKEATKPSRLSEKVKSGRESFLEKVDTFFINHIQELTCGRENIRIFVPLCGNSADMLWLVKHGHSVIGVELMAKWIKSFFRKSELKYTVTSVELASKKEVDVYRAEDQNIVIYNCSIFDYDLSSAGDKFDGIWDQSAMPVINEMGEDKLQQYANLLQSLLAPNGRHVVEVCKHGANFVTTEKLKELYGENCDVRYLGTRLWKYEEEDDDDDDDSCTDKHMEDDQQGHARLTSHEKHYRNEHSHESHHDHSYAIHHHAGHGNGDHDSESSEDIEMFYHVISFKEI